MECLNCDNESELFDDPDKATQWECTCESPDYQGGTDYSDEDEGE